MLAFRGGSVSYERGTFVTNLIEGGGGGASAQWSTRGSLGRHFDRYVTKFAPRKALK